RVATVRPRVIERQAPTAQTQHSFGSTRLRRSDQTHPSGREDPHESPSKTLRFTSRFFSALVACPLSAPTRATARAARYAGDQVPVRAAARSPPSSRGSGG